MRWPSPQDYREAIQTQTVSLGDEELRSGELELDALQLPLVNSGQYAAVFKISGNSKAWAVRCFLHDFADRQERYKTISAYLEKLNVEYLVDFELIDKGIRVGDKWFPILKMEYVLGKPLGRYVRENISDGAKLTDLRSQFNRLMFDLKRFGIAHGDLQHDNIVVTEDGQLRLIDYDGMFVPGLEGLLSNELGHRNYQHPGRSEADFNASIDNFSGWLISGALDCLIAQKQAHDKFLSNDEAFFLSREDFLFPDNSKVLFELEKNGDVSKHFSRQMRTLVKNSVAAVPFLNEPLQIDGKLRGIELRKKSIRAVANAQLIPLHGDQNLVETGADLGAKNLLATTSDLSKISSRLPALSSFVRTEVAKVSGFEQESTNRQAALNSVLHQFKQGETLVWTGGLSPTKMSTAQQNFDDGVFATNKVLNFALIAFVFMCGVLIHSLHLPFVFNFFPILIALAALTGPGSLRSDGQMAYVLTEKHLRILYLESRDFNPSCKYNESPVFSVEIPVRKIKFARFPVGRECYEERVQLQIEEFSKGLNGIPRNQTFWLHGFTEADRRALMTRLRGLGVQCSEGS